MVLSVSFLLPGINAYYRFIRYEYTKKRILHCTNDISVGCSETKGAINQETYRVLEEVRSTFSVVI